MKKLFISQPMADKTEDEILEERKKAICLAKEMVGEDVQIIDSYIYDDPPEDTKSRGLWFLGESIKLLADADVAYFAHGWDDARGRRIEHDCAISYGVKCIIA